MKSFLAYCILILQVTKALETEQVNTPVDPDEEVKLFNKQTSTTWIETLLLFVHKYSETSIKQTPLGPFQVSAYWRVSA